MLSKQYLRLQIGNFPGVARTSVFKETGENLAELRRAFGGVLAGF